MLQAGIGNFCPLQLEVLKVCQPSEMRSATVPHANIRANTAVSRHIIASFRAGVMQDTRGMEEGTSTQADTEQERPVLAAHVK